ncbi:hypothetical protein ACFE04_020211 [Oxalis oulophora]
MDELIEAFLSLTDSSPALSIDPRRPHHCPTTLPVRQTLTGHTTAQQPFPSPPHHCPTTLPVRQTLAGHTTASNPSQLLGKRKRKQREETTEDGNRERRQRTTEVATGIEGHTTAQLLVICIAIVFVVGYNGRRRRPGRLLHDFYFLRSNNNNNNRKKMRVGGVRMESSKKEDSEFVDVICIGSRKDSVFDFCLDSPLHSSSSSLRFWNIVTNNEPGGNVQLLRKTLHTNINTTKNNQQQQQQQHHLVDASLFLQSSCPNPKAIILVASAGYASDHLTAIDMLKTIKSANGLAIAIFLNPFNFEGKTRLHQIKYLFNKVQDHATICIDIETDSLLKKDLVTLAEALRTANGAVLLAINSLSVLISESQRKFSDTPHNNFKELHASEVVKILESFKKAKVGFGAGYNIKSSILQAVYDCPFIGSSLKDLDGVVMCTIASSSLICNSDLHAFLHTFRQTTGYTNEIIISPTHETNLEPSLLVTTVVILSIVGGGLVMLYYIGLYPTGSFFSKYHLEVAYVSHKDGHSSCIREHQRSDEAKEENINGNSLATNLLDSSQMENKVVEESIKDFDSYAVEVSRELSSNDGNIDSSCLESKQNDGALPGSKTVSSNIYEQLDRVTEMHNLGTIAFHRDSVNGLNMGPAYQIAQDWAKERAVDTISTSMHNNLSIFCLPVGVRPSDDLKGEASVSHNTDQKELKTEDDSKIQPLTKLFTDVGVEAIRGFYDTASTLIKRKPNDAPKKEGVLSARAASMLEAERDMPKKWNPVVEMQFRGGVYKGRCQGGLPEGKGRLTLGDGSIYDGTWHYGTRSGLGTFYFSNGDVFQGSWRDDVIHGKGWYYFHTGDRWFANFWKGKANGESRFYSKSGDVLFGRFQDGLRHGSFLCIDLDGTRFIEVWDEGILICRSELDSDTIAQ